MSVTFDIVQQRFEQVWRDERKLPTSLVISESDYDTFFNSMWTQHEWTPFEQDMLGTERVALLDGQREKAKQNLSGIINCVNNRAVPLLRDPKQLQGVLKFTWEQTIYE